MKWHINKVCNLSFHRLLRIGTSSVVLLDSSLRCQETFLPFFFLQPTSGSLPLWSIPGGRSCDHTEEAMNKTLHCVVRREGVASLLLCGWIIWPILVRRRIRPSRNIWFGDTEVSIHLSAMNNGIPQLLSHHLRKGTESEEERRGSGKEGKLTNLLEYLGKLIEKKHVWALGRYWSGFKVASSPTALCILNFCGNSTSLGGKVGLAQTNLKNKLFSSSVNSFKTSQKYWIWESCEVISSSYSVLAINLSTSMTFDPPTNCSNSYLKNKNITLQVIPY